ncbi:toxin [Streptomyces sp. S.PNR 29]|uniref:toxin n=1 Tax=Streptomyces sp. S.PNR 29 TaxID=2973805 RepID=UPI0025B1AF0E|nr:toxin [Streptomyces sp. S.PNR 29]MDN0194427.1 toxin [Streptomyces sp. S.PNR 29]
MRTSKEMRRLADTLIDPIRVPVPVDPEVLFEALVESVSAWRGREVAVHRAAFPPHTASGLWLERDTHDDVVVDQRAAVWHQIVILCHEVWHMYRQQSSAPPEADGELPRLVAARTDFSLAEEQEADRFGMLMGRRLRTWLEASADSALAARGDDAQDLAGRIGAALDYRGTRR